MSVTFGAVCKSEWTKLVTVRSTFALLAIAFLFILAGFALEAIDVESRDSLDDALAVGLRSGVMLAQLAIAVLGALTVTGEYSSGMIRATLAAVPTRLPVLGAKAAALAALTFVVSLIACLFGGLVAAAIYAEGDIWAALTNPDFVRALLAGGAYLAGIAVLGSALGWLFRSAAAAVAIMAGLIIMLPIVLPLIRLDWVETMGALLPSEIGRQMMRINGAVTDPASLGLTPWTSTAIYAAYALVALVAAAIVLRRRDA